MEGAKRKIHRLRNSLSHRLSSTEVGHQDGNALLSSDGSPRTLSNAHSGSQSQEHRSNSKAYEPSRDTPVSFIKKKNAILEKLALPEGEYSDKSPKGSVDEGARELIELLNGSEGWVTTSSCAGRVSVFVEGKRETNEVEVDGDNQEDQGTGGDERAAGEEANMNGEEDAQDESGGNEGPKRPGKQLRTGLGGKGGGKWLHVSHDPIPAEPPSEQRDTYFTKLFGLEPMTSSTTFPHLANGQPPRLIHLTFSPLILHILAASLQHARPLLAAAINAGFRESGVQSLKALEDEEAGVMIGIRTAGLMFETVIGVTIQDEDAEEKMQAVVSEEYLSMCVAVVNERFVGNKKRKERLIKELEGVVTKEREELSGEVEDDRRLRKKQEGLKRQQELQDERSKEKEEETNDDVLEGGLDVSISK